MESDSQVKVREISNDGSLKDLSLGDFVIFKDEVDNLKELVLSCDEGSIRTFLRDREGRGYIANRLHLDFVYDNRDPLFVEEVDREDYDFLWYAYNLSLEMI